MRMEIGEIIRMAREEKGMSEMVCARICRCALNDYRKMEEGKLAFGRGEIVLLANALEISSSALQEGRFVRKKDMPDLLTRINKLEAKIAEVKMGFIEIRNMIDEMMMEGIFKNLPAAPHPEPEEERSEELCLK